MVPGNAPSRLSSSAEFQAWIAKLEAQDRSIGRRNKILIWVLGAGVALLIGAGWWVYRSTVRCYAVLDGVQIERQGANQGRLEIVFRVVSPGKVFYRRTSGSTRTEVIDYFDSPGEVRRLWSWVYEPGEDIVVSLTYRGGLLRRTARGRFPTAKRADIVVLMDTTGSMSRSIGMLKEKCAAFSAQLKEQSLEHRFALVGFGDTHEPAWLDKYDFTDDVEQFRKQVAGIKRFDGGDFPESALDAIEEALSLPFNRDAIRRFYLVTDATFHKPTRTGKSVADISSRLQQEQVLLSVFSRAEFDEEYKELLGDTGKFYEMEEFGKVLSEGRILED